MPDRKSSLLILVSIAMSITLTGCLGGSTDNQGGPSGGGREITELEKIEVREYEGKDLSSITDFRENSIDGPQYVDSDTYSMTVGGLVDTPLELTYDEVIDRDRYSKVVQLDCVEGWSVDILWEGVLVRDILEQAGYDPEAEVLILRAEDGYSTSLPLDFVVDNDILLAYRMNDVTMPPERGYPFQLVAEEHWGYKWIKWVVEIEVSNDTSFRGYWESRGYSNGAELDSGFRE
ncbi:MAG: molybdopterin-dependent oxidoreductase [Actinomycetota bacterium]|jgi:DMSO/TMAO reductase YedYZ molybdopterin-dependent catalytic subunit|nr:molybdopterin-dependent oxidoreductase [Actinomycetota bacterium]